MTEDNKLIKADPVPAPLPAGTGTREALATPLEPIEESTAAKHEEKEIDGESPRPGIESTFIEADDLEVWLEEVDPTPMRCRLRGGPLPEFEDEEAPRVQMRADTTQAL